MSPLTIFNVQLGLGYVAWLLFFNAYVRPKLKSADVVAVQRAIATLHSFRFFGLVFLVPGLVGHLPASFAAPAAYWDLATAILAMLALLAEKVRPIFFTFVVAFNLVGVVDLILDYYRAVESGVPAIAGQMIVAYAIPIIYVPLLMITHIIAFTLLVRPQTLTVRALRAEAPAS